jgi:UDP-glucose 4-epimerase
MRMKLENRKVLVTGGAGFIGSHLVDRLVEKGNHVLILDNLSSGKIDFLSKSKEKIDIINQDIMDGESLISVFEGVDVVVHLAANPQVKISDDQTKVHVDQNILATHNILEAMRRNRVEDILFASTSTIYGEVVKIPTPEDYGPLIPISLYAASKLACEALISAYCYTYDMRSTIYRFANVIGSRSTHGVIFDFMNKLKADPDTLEILGREPGTRKSYVHISDCIAGMIHAYEYSDERVGIYNIGSDDCIDVRTIADIVSREMGLKDLTYHWTGGVDDGRGWKGDVKSMLLDIERIRALGWEPQYTSSDAVSLTIRELVKV